MPNFCHFSTDVVLNRFAKILVSLTEKAFRSHFLSILVLHSQRTFVVVLQLVSRLSARDSLVSYQLKMAMSRISSTTSSAADSSNSKAVPLITSTTSSWPSVFDESYEMILAAIMIYGIVDLRTLAREGLIDGRLMTVPISSTDIVQLVMQNRSAIYDNIGYDAAALYLDAFDSISQQEQEGFEVDYNSETGETSLRSILARWLRLRRTSQRGGNHLALLLSPLPLAYHCASCPCDGETD